MTKEQVDKLEGVNKNDWYRNKDFFKYNTDPDEPEKDDESEEVEEKEGDEHLPRHFEDLEPCILDDLGLYKYILIEIKDWASQDKMYIIRGYKDCAQHVDILNRFKYEELRRVPKFLKKHWEIKCPEVGRVDRIIEEASKGKEECKKMFIYWIIVDGEAMVNDSVQSQKLISRAYRDHVVQYAWDPEKAMDKTNVHKIIDAEEMINDEREDTLRYPCPCGDGMRLPEEKDYMDIAICPSCSLSVRVKY